MPVTPVEGSSQFRPAGMDSEMERASQNFMKQGRDAGLSGQKLIMANRAFTMSLNGEVAVTLRNEQGLEKGAAVNVPYAEACKWVKNNPQKVDEIASKVISANGGKVEPKTPQSQKPPAPTITVNSFDPLGDVVRPRINDAPLPPSSTDDLSEMNRAENKFMEKGRASGLSGQKLYMANRVFTTTLNGKAAEGIREKQGLKEGAPVDVSYDETCEWIKKNPEKVDDIASKVISANGGKLPEGQSR